MTISYSITRTPMKFTSDLSTLIAAGDTKTWHGATMCVSAESDGDNFAFEINGDRVERYLHGFEFNDGVWQIDIADYDSEYVRYTATPE